jgi:DNA-binding NarL/FixJ family response regulator
MTIRIVLADDHQLVRAGFRALLESFEGCEVVGEATDGSELMAVLAAVQADLVLVDIEMPLMDGLEAIDRMRTAHPNLRAIVLSMNESGALAKRALRKGAAGYVLKQGAASELELAVRSVMDRGSYLSASIARNLAHSSNVTPEDALTARQIEILTRLAQGKSSREIAAELKLSAKTVDVHRTRIMERLGLSDLPGLTRYALRHRLVH